MEIMMEKLLNDQEHQREAIKTLTCQMGKLFAHNNILENQITSQAFTSGLRKTWKLPSQLENPREQAKVITLRCEK